MFTLAGQSRHIVTSVSQDPALAPEIQSLRLSVATRYCSIESERLRDWNSRKATGGAVPDIEAEKGIAADTAGMATLGWGIEAWASEYVGNPCPVSSAELQTGASP